MRLKSFKKVLVIISFLSLPVLAGAQFDPDPDPPDPLDNPEPLPFDAGLTALIGVGIAYAAKKRYDKRKAEKENKG